MPSNAEIAERFREIADLLDVLGERFKPEAYRRAARSLDDLPEDISAYAARGKLRQIPGIGEALAAKVEEYLRDGRIAYRDRLAAEIPSGVVALMKLPGLGPKTARRLWVELQIDGPQALREAIDAGRLAGVKGFGDRKVALFREAATAPAPVARLPLWEAYETGTGLVAALRERVPLDRVELAGSLRRARESVGDLDLLTTSPNPSKVMEAFTTLPEVREIRLKGPTKSTVLLASGRQVDLRVVPAESFGAALQYFTGSKEHNVKLRSRAQRLGLRVNEYGVNRGSTRLAGATEAEVYRALGLAEIPPELREDRGEIDAAEAGRLPRLLSAGDLAGDLHVHLPPGAGAEEAADAARSARDLGHRVVGLVLPPDATPEGFGRLRRDVGAAETGLRILWGVERGWKAPAWGGAPAVDFVLLTPSGPDPPEGPPPAGGFPGVSTVLAHLSLDRSGLGESDPVRSEAWIDWAAARGIALELPPTAARDGLDSTSARAARERGLPLVVTGLSERRCDPKRLQVAVALARRAGLGPADVRNVSESPLWPAPELTPARPGPPVERPAAPSAGRRRRSRP